MNKQEILTEIEELKERLNSLEKMYNSVSDKRWRGDKDDDYYFISALGTVYRDTENVKAVDNARYDIGNYFQTKEEAEFEAERLKVVTELREWATPISEFNWNDAAEKKYVILLELDEVKVDSFALYQISDLFFKTKEQAESAIRTVGKERILKYYFKR